jgi:hypothetical protein
MTNGDAFTADRAGDLQVAASRYEELLASGGATLETVLNLAVLYWQATDTGMAAAQRLPPEFLATAGRRFPELLEEAARRFPMSTEVRFWRRYIAWADLGEPSAPRSVWSFFEKTRQPSSPPCMSSPYARARSPKQKLVSCYNDVVQSGQRAHATWRPSSRASCEGRLEAEPHPKPRGQGHCDGAVPIPALPQDQIVVGVLDASVCRLEGGVAASRTDRIQLSEREGHGSASTALRNGL